MLGLELPEPLRLRLVRFMVRVNARVKVSVRVAVRNSCMGVKGHMGLVRVRARVGLRRGLELGKCM